MGCDAYASEIGELHILITRYEDGKFLAEVKVENLKPGEKIRVEYLEGKER